MKSNNLAKMIGKRVVQSCITILLVTLFVFALIQMVPGDPVANYLGATATEEQIAYYRHLYGFDRPVIVQYLSWIGGLFRGTMGRLYHWYDHRYPVRHHCCQEPRQDH